MKDVKNITFTKKKAIHDKVVFIDGTAHVGKLLLGPVLSTYKNVDIQKLETAFEHIAVLYHFNKISLDGAVTFMRNFLDESLYNAAIGRNINFRPTDLSSVFNGKNQARYLSRLFMSEGADAVERIRSSRTVYQNLTHEILGYIEPCFAAFGNKLFVIEVIRHPSDLLLCWLRRGWGEDRFGLDPRSFIISFEHEGQQMPYFSYAFKDKYHAMTPVERVVNCINACNSQILRTYKALPADLKDQVMFVKFESFVTETRKELERISEFISLEEGPDLEAVMTEQRCPRELNLNARDEEIEKILEGEAPSVRQLLNKMIDEYISIDPYRMKNL